MVGWEVAVSVGDDAACEVLSAVAGVTASACARAVCQPPPNRAWPRGSRATDDRCRGAGATGLGRGWGRPEEAALWEGIPRRLRPYRIHVSAAHVPALLHTSDHIYPHCTVWESEAQTGEATCPGVTCA
jgi:hypothetical protein